MVRPREWRGLLLSGGSLTVKSSTIRDSDAGDASRVTLIGSSITGNYARGGGGGGIGTGAGDGIFVKTGRVTLRDSTVADNSAHDGFDDFGNGGGLSLYANSFVDICNSSIVNNSSGAYFYRTAGGGVFIEPGSAANIANSIVAGNSVTSRTWTGSAPDVAGAITQSNGHNLFGSTVAGTIPGDRQNVAPATVFAAWKRGFCRRMPAGSVEPERGRPEMKCRLGEVVGSVMPRSAGAVRPVSRWAAHGKATQGEHSTVRRGRLVSFRVAWIHYLFFIRRYCLGRNMKWPI